MSNRLATLAPLALCLAHAAPTFAGPCTGHGVELQVLGSGGPEMQTKRASSGYLIWRDGKARVLIDSGGGTALRFGEAGATMTDLDAILYTHFHADHSADFPALIKSSFFEDRTRTLPVYGPAGNRSFPSATAFARAMLDPDKGAFRYLGGFLSGDAGYKLDVHDIAPKPASPLERIPLASGITLQATSVEHGTVPALAWRVDVDGVSVAFSGDTNGNNGALEKLSQGATLLVAHNAVPEGAEGVERALHMPPSVIGKIASAAHVKALVLSHRMLRTLGKEPETKHLIEETYKGPLAFAGDLDCFPLAP